MKTRNGYQWLIAGAIFLCFLGNLSADEIYSGGMIVDIDYDVYGYVWVEDATVNLYENTHIINDAFWGDIFATSGSIINIYGGQIDGYLFISTAANGLPEAQVTVFGSDFAVDGIPVQAGIAELFLQDQELSGVYASGTPFSIMVDCAVTADFYLTVKLGWIDSEADIDVPQVEYDFGQVNIGTTQNGIVTVYNTGNTNLTLQSVNIVESEEFGVAPLQQLPITIEPDSAANIDILYTPEQEGFAEAILQIFSDDPDEPVVETALYGEGLKMVYTPAEVMAMIIDFYQASLEDGSIEGLVRGRSGTRRVHVFGKKLLVIQQLIAAGYEKHALMALKIVEKQCDGNKRGCDLIQGEGVPALNAMINELMDSLKESM